MLNLDHVNSYYGRSHILHDVNLAVGEGDVVSVIGRNGVGKTTLLKCIMGLTDHVSGRLELDGHDITLEPTYVRARYGIGYAPQGREIISNFSVRENILMGCYARPDGKREIPPLVFDLFPFLRGHLDRRGGLLSGGQQQQLAIARALASKPRILLLDEPSEGIQPNIVEQIEATIQRLNRELGLTLIVVEQNVDFARCTSKHFVILQKGSIVARGSIKELTNELVYKYLTV
jgi:urea transport system ATP-binding protein